MAVTDPPTKEGIQEFWGNLFGDQDFHNEEASWLTQERKEMESVDNQQWTDITTEIVRSRCKKLSNWKAPGLDKVQNFWLKHLEPLHQHIARLFQDITTQPSHTPTWLTLGATSLIHKKGPTNNAKNYRPITCLPTYYKLLTMIFTDLVYDHVIENEILPLEQKGVRRKARGCKDQLLLDKAITEDARRKRKALSMIWIDYKKAYDSVPHSWIIACLKLYKVNERIIEFIKHTMTKWKTKLTLHHEGGAIESDEITFLRGIFQGDTLSPLIFCLAMAPISHILKRNGIGYKISDITVSNSFYIDDLKLYAANAKQMEKGRKLVEEVSKDIKMSLNLDKCAELHSTKGKINNSPEPSTMPTITGEEESYKYLGIVEGDSIKHEEAKRTAKKVYLKRIRSILKSGINAKFTTDAIRTYAMPILRYGFGILKWRKAELTGIDRKVRKILTKGGFHNPKSNTHRLYLSRDKGGRGLIGAEDCHRQECSALAKYIKSNNDPLTTIIRASETPKVHGLLSYEGTPKEATTKAIDDEHNENLLKMNLHGSYFKDRNSIPTLNPQKSSKWLKSPFMRFETESLLCAAQEQALPTNCLRSRIWGQSTTSKCRLCKERDETISHIVSGCSMLAGTQYLHRHNQVAKYLHWNILRDIGVDTTNSWLDHKPKEITTKGKKNILWDSYIKTDKKVGHNKPDVIIHDEEKRECILIDVAIPVCQNIVKKEAEKITKYRDLEIELKKCWKLEKKRKRKLYQ